MIGKNNTEAIDQIRANIERFGWHVYLVIGVQPSKQGQQRAAAHFCPFSFLPWLPLRSGLFAAYRHFLL